jgi:AbrB family looped-hinge helix DNA binding protein
LNPAKCHFRLANGICECHNGGMQVTIDQAGRIVVPKAVRERLGLHKGSELELKESPEGIVLQPVERTSALARRNGRLVIVARPPKDFDPVRAVEEDREERMRYIGGR